MRLPQEIRDAICLHAGSEKVCVALIASAFVRNILSRRRREKFVQKLGDFISDDVARRGGMGSRDEPGHIGWWEILERDRNRFVDGVCDAVVIDFHHSDEHYYNHHWSHGPHHHHDDDLSPILAETSSCLELHIPCILTFGGYITDRNLNVAGRRWTLGVRHKGQLDICSATDPI
jgi:hypothetical protein